jgi:hypothetical protein
MRSGIEALLTYPVPWKSNVGDERQRRSIHLHYPSVVQIPPQETLVVRSGPWLSRVGFVRIKDFRPRLEGRSHGLGKRPALAENSRIQKHPSCRR